MVSRKLKALVDDTRNAVDRFPYSLQFMYYSVDSGNNSITKSLLHNLDS